MEPHERHNVINIAKVTGEAIGGIIGDHIPAARREEIAGDLLVFLNQLEEFASAGAPIFVGRETVIAVMAGLGFKPDGKRAS